MRDSQLDQKQHGPGGKPRCVRALGCRSTSTAAAGDAPRHKIVRCPRLPPPSCEHKMWASPLLRPLLSESGRACSPRDGPAAGLSRRPRQARRGASMLNRAARRLGPQSAPCPASSGPLPSKRPLTVVKGAEESTLDGVPGPSVACARLRGAADLLRHNDRIGRTLLPRLDSNELARVKPRFESTT